MKTSLTLFVVLCIAIALMVPSHAADDLSPQGVLSVAKMAGACGILDSMIQLQKTTKLPGGDEFVTRFWSVEAARLGYSVQQLSDVCDKSIEVYNRLLSAAEERKQGR